MTPFAFHLPASQASALQLHLSMGATTRPFANSIAS